MNNYDTAVAVACLGDAFLKILKKGCSNLSEFEHMSVKIGHEVIADAIGWALETYDSRLCTHLPEGSGSMKDAQGRLLLWSGM